MCRAAWQHRLIIPNPAPPDGCGNQAIPLKTGPARSMSAMAMFQQPSKNPRQEGFLKRAQSERLTIVRRRLEAF